VMEMNSCRCDIGGTGGTGRVVGDASPTQGSVSAVANGSIGPSAGSGAASVTGAAQGGANALANTGAVDRVVVLPSTGMRQERAIIAAPAGCSSPGTSSSPDTSLPGWLARSPRARMVSGGSHGLGATAAR
jgi:hypothetical protein